MKKSKIEDLIPPDKKKYFVTSYFEIEGLHCWPGVVKTKCSEKYLVNEHRHVFKFRVKIPVTHTDRDVEFIEFGHKVKAELLNTFKSRVPFVAHFLTMSCEALGVWILEKFPEVVSVEVTEDGESGAIVERE